MSAPQLDRALYRLCVAANIGGSTYSRWIWLGTSQLRGSWVLAPDEDTAAFIRRNFLAAFRQVIADCEVRVEPAPLRESASVVKRAYRGQLERGRQGDFLK